ncbi:variant erythrocyte surface antigen-1 family protein [Babesia caballi]|uniref:Variant erythrocyte surface antigen-1 family protein n=1 Tax=Babesia caballi TaxID=5871 RepID=A0AAV4LR61_BABCB|nr:variant erythrocyte surface antigen-1 family protein [Babesia caballi]
MGAQKTQLTDWPDNLKDAIDWFLRVGGKDGQTTGGDNDASKLAKAIVKLEGFSVNLPGIDKTHGVEGLFNKIAKGLQQFIGYSINGNHALTGEGIGSNYGSSRYTSSYSNKAQWKEGLNKPGAPDANKVALIFLGTMPMVYFGITYLCWRCSTNHVGWATNRLNVINSPLYLFMSANGFSRSSELKDISAKEVATLLKDKYDSFDDLKNAPRDQYTYSGFLNKFEEQSASNSAINCPLISCQKLAKAYLTSQFESDKAGDATLRDIKEKLQHFSTSCKTFAPELQSEIETFLRDIKANRPKTDAAPSDKPSPASAVAGTLTTFGLGGGAAAAYLLDLGGAKTLVNGLLRIG